MSIRIEFGSCTSFVFQTDVMIVEVLVKAITHNAGWKFMDATKPRFIIGWINIDISPCAG